MVNENNYGRMASEVLELLKHFPKEKVDKIPKALLEQFEKGKDGRKVFIDDSKKIFEQDVCDETQIMMYLIYRDYWATPDERLKIDQTLKQINKDYNEKYSAENIFKRPEDKAR